MGENDTFGYVILASMFGGLIIIGIVIFIITMSNNSNQQETNETTSTANFMTEANDIKKYKRDGKTPIKLRNSVIVNEKVQPITSVEPVKEIEPPKHFDQVISIGQPPLMYVGENPNYEPVFIREYMDIQSTSVTDCDGRLSFDVATPNIRSKSINFDDSLTPVGDFCQQLNVKRQFESTPNGGHYATSKDDGVIDVINYSNNIIYLYHDGSLKKDDIYIKIALRPKVESKIKMLTVFDGYIMALIKDKVYRLSNDTFDYKLWTFYEYDKKLEGVRRISSTLDGNTFVVQYDDRIELYDMNGNLVTESIGNTVKRVYGNKRTRYIDLNLVTKEAVDNEGVMYRDVLDVIIDHKDNVVILSMKLGMEKGYTSLRLVNWDPYYLLSR